MDWSKFGFDIPDDYEMPDDHETFTDDEKFFLVAVGLGRAMQLNQNKPGVKDIVHEIIKGGLLLLREEVKDSHHEKAKKLSKAHAQKCGCKVCQDLLKWIDEMQAKKESKRADVVDPFSESFE